MNGIRIFISFSLGLISAITFSSAHAAQSSEGVIEEIIVTAQKRNRTSRILLYRSPRSVQMPLSS